MSGSLVITGTDTDVGKTVVAAGLAGCLHGAYYWKPIQAGTEPQTDRARVRHLSGLPPERLLPEAYCLAMAASPHLAARMEDVTIEVDALAPPSVRGPLIIEGAGGILVPISAQASMADLFVHWGAPVVLVARTGLGTINHSLLSIEALRTRGIRIGGIVFVGEAHMENERIIPAISGVRSLGRLPMIDPLTPETLRAAIGRHIDIAAIEALLA